MEHDERRANFMLHFSSGMELQRRERWHHAAAQYAKASMYDPSDITTVVLRAQCLLAVGDAVSASEEATKVLRLEAQHGIEKAYRGILLRADVLYSQGNFEQAMKYYHQGKEIRNDLVAFEQGIAKCEEALVGTVTPATSATPKPPTSHRPSSAKKRPATTGTQSEYGRCMPELGKDAAFLKKLAKSSLFSNDKNINNVFHSNFCQNNHNHPHNKYIRQRQRKKKAADDGNDDARAIATTDWTEEELMRMMDKSVNDSKVKAGNSKITAVRQRAKLQSAKRAKPMSTDSLVSSEKNEAMTELVDNTLKFLDVRHKFWVHNDPAIRFPPPQPAAVTFNIGAKETPPPRLLSSNSKLLRETASSRCHRESASLWEDDVEPRGPMFSNLQRVTNQTPAPIREHMITLSPTRTRKPQPPSKPSPLSAELIDSMGGKLGNNPFAGNGAAVEFRWAHYNDHNGQAERTVQDTIRDKIGTSLAYEEPLRKGDQVQHAYNGSQFAVCRSLDEDPDTTPAVLSDYFGLGRAATKVGISSKAKHRRGSKTPNGPTPRPRSRTNSAAQHQEHLQQQHQPPAQQQPQKMMSIDRYDDDGQSTATSATGISTKELRVASVGQLRSLEKEIAQVKRLVEFDEFPRAVQLVQSLKDEVGKLGPVDGSTSPQQLLSNLRLLLGDIYLQMGETGLAIKELSRAVAEARSAGDKAVSAAAVKLLVNIYSSCSEECIVDGDQVSDMDDEDEERRRHVENEQDLDLEEFGDGLDVMPDAESSVSCSEYDTESDDDE